MTKPKSDKPIIETSPPRPPEEFNVILELPIIYPLITEAELEAITLEAVERAATPEEAERLLENMRLRRQIIKLPLTFVMNAPAVNIVQRPPEPPPPPTLEQVQAKARAAIKTRPSHRDPKAEIARLFGERKAE